MLWNGHTHPQFPLFFIFTNRRPETKQKMISKLQQKTNDGELLQQQKRSRASPSNWVDKLPKEMWTYHVLPCSTLKELKELSELSHNSLFSEFWKSVVESCHHIHVVCGREGNIWERQTRIGISECLRPQLYCSTIERAVYVATHMAVPGTVTIELSKGVHEICGDEDGSVASEDNDNDDDDYDDLPFVPAAGGIKTKSSCQKLAAGSMLVTRSHITFVGSGKDKTMIHGGFEVVNQQNVRFEELTVTNQHGNALYLSGSETNVDMLKCVVKECYHFGMYMHRGATVTATQCEFTKNCEDGVYCGNGNTKARLNDCTIHHNGGNGLIAVGDGLIAVGHDGQSCNAVVDLHGSKTDIHSNQDRGIHCCCANVNIHLPSQHNTSHDNVGEDQRQSNGGSIANINADGTIIE